MGDADWQDRAACADHPEPDLFHPTPGGMTRDKAQAIRDAKEVCGWCPVRAECLRAAVANDYAGIWGGTTDDERRRLGARPGQPPVRPNAPTPDERCGTYAGAARHRKLRERFCDDCRDARNAYETNRKRELRAAALEEMSA